MGAANPGYDPSGLRMLRVALQNAIEGLGGKVSYPGFPMWEAGENPYGEPEVIEFAHDLPVPEPSDVKVVGLVSALPTITSGVGQNGTEVKFNADGIIIPIPGAIGAFWSRSLKNRWAGIQPGRPIAYTQEQSFFVAQDTTVQIGGNLALEFYAKPQGMHLKHFYQRVRDWTAQSGEGGAGGIISAQSGFFPGSSSDVTLGTFTQTGGSPTQIFLAGTNMVVGGATKAGQLFINTDGANTDEIFVGETSALAIASNNPIGASGQDVWYIPKGGKLFFLSKSGTQSIGARFRS